MACTSNLVEASALRASSNRVTDDLDWIVGAWTRAYIRRAAAPGGPLGPRDTGVDVRYVQTPWAFVDIRRPTDAARLDGTLAFGGVTTRGDGAEREAHWHTCVDIEWRIDEADGGAARSAAAWAAADAGSPLPTPDVGHFTRLIESDGESSGGRDDEAWIEVDPEATLEEKWLHHVVGSVVEGKEACHFLARRRGSALLVAAETQWALADGTSGRFAAGTIVRSGSGDSGDGGSDATQSKRTWRIEVCADDRALEGTTLCLSGSAEEWVALRGESREWGVASSSSAAVGDNAVVFPLPLFS